MQPARAIAITIYHHLVSSCNGLNPHCIAEDNTQPGGNMRPVHGAISHRIHTSKIIRQYRTQSRSNNKYSAVLTSSPASTATCGIYTLLSKDPIYRDHWDNSRKGGFPPTVISIIFMLQRFGFAKMENISPCSLSSRVGAVQYSTVQYLTSSKKWIFERVHAIKCSVKTAVLLPCHQALSIYYSNSSDYLYSTFNRNKTRRVRRVSHWISEEEKSGSTIHLVMSWLESPSIMVPFVLHRDPNLTKRRGWLLDWLLVRWYCGQHGCYWMDLWRD